MNEEWEPWLVQDKDKRECWRRKASGHVHGLKDQSKYKTKKPKKQNFEETFWFSLKKCFFWFSFCFFLVLKCKSRKNIAFFVFLKVYGWRKSPKTKKTQSTQNQKSKNQNFEETFWFSLKTCFFGFHFVFFRLWNAKAEKTLCFFVFLKVYGWRKSPKTKKTQSKHKTKNQKTKTLKRLFGLASKNVFFLIFILFFLALKCKSRKNIVFFVFFEGLWLEKITKHKKNKFFFCISKPKKNKENKKHLLRLNQKVSSKLCFFFGFWFRSFGVIIILYILQAFRCTKITNRVYIIYVCVLYVCMCVVKDMIQEALRWISGGGYHIHIIFNYAM